MTKGRLDGGNAILIATLLLIRDRRLINIQDRTRFARTSIARSRLFSLINSNLSMPIVKVAPRCVSRDIAGDLLVIYTRSVNLFPASLMSHSSIYRPIKCNFNAPRRPSASACVTIITSTQVILFFFCKTINVNDKFNTVELFW